MRPRGSFGFPLSRSWRCTRKLDSGCVTAARVNKELRIATEQDKDDMAAKLDIAFAQIPKEQNTNAIICSQLSTKCKVHDSMHDNVQAFQTWLVVTAKKRNMHKCTIQAVGKDIAASREIQHTLAMTNKMLSRDLVEKNCYVEIPKMRTWFQSATD